MADERGAPDAPLEDNDARAHRRAIAMRANRALNKDGSNAMLAPLALQSVAFADLPDPALWAGALIHVTDDIGGAVPAFSDGTNWRRVTDRAVVSDV